MFLSLDTNESTTLLRNNNKSREKKVGGQICITRLFFFLHPQPKKKSFLPFARDDLMNLVVGNPPICREKKKSEKKVGAQKCATRLFFYYETEYMVRAPIPGHE